MRALGFSRSAGRMNRDVPINWHQHTDHWGHVWHLWLRGDVFRLGTGCPHHLVRI